MPGAVVPHDVELAAWYPLDGSDEASSADVAALRGPQLTLK